MNLATGAFTLFDNDRSDNVSTGTFGLLSGAASGTYVEVNPSASGSFTGRRL